MSQIRIFLARSLRITSISQDEISERKMLKIYRFLPSRQNRTILKVTENVKPYNIVRHFRETR